MFKKIKLNCLSHKRFQVVAFLQSTLVSAHFVICQHHTPYVNIGMNLHFKVFYKSNALVSTLKCLSIGTPKAINFPFVSNEKLMFLGVPVCKHIVMRL